MNLSCLLERISILEYLIDNSIPITIETYTKYSNEFALRKECYLLANKTINYTDEDFYAIYPNSTKKGLHLKRINDIQKASLILLDTELSLATKIVGIRKIYISKIYFEQETITLRKHLIDDNKLNGFEKLINLIKNFFNTLHKDQAFSLVKQEKARQAALSDDTVMTAYNIITLYITSDATKDDDAFCNEQGISKQQLKESAIKIKGLWPNIYQKYLERTNQNIGLKMPQHFSAIIEASLSISNKTLLRPSNILANFPFKDSYDRETFEKIAYFINPNYGDVNAFFGFDESLYIEHIYKKQNALVTQHKKELPNNPNLLCPNSLKGRVLAIAKKIDTTFYETLNNFFQTTGINIYDSMQDTSIERQKLYNLYKNSIMGKLPTRNIAGIILKECVLAFTEEEVTDILDYMEYFNIPYREETFKLVAQEYKNGLITKQEINKLREHYSKKLSNPNKK